MGGGPPGHNHIYTYTYVHTRIYIRHENAAHVCMCEFLQHAYAFVVYTFHVAKSSAIRRLMVRDQRCHRSIHITYWYSYSILCCFVNVRTQCLHISLHVYLDMPAYLSSGIPAVLHTCTCVEAPAGTSKIHMDTTMNRWVHTWLKPDWHTCSVLTTNLRLYGTCRNFDNVYLNCLCKVDNLNGQH